LDSQPTGVGALTYAVDQELSRMYGRLRRHLQMDGIAPEQLELDLAALETVVDKIGHLYRHLEESHHRLIAIAEQWKSEAGETAQCVAAYGDLPLEDEEAPILGL
jgi:hypothetical protein